MYIFPVERSVMRGVYMLQNFKDDQYFYPNICTWPFYSTKINCKILYHTLFNIHKYSVYMCLQHISYSTLFDGKLMWCTCFLFSQIILKCDLWTFCCYERLWCLILDKYQFDCRFNFKNISVFYQDKLCTTLKIVSDSEVEETPDTVETVALPPPPFSFSGNNYTKIHKI